MNKTNVDNMLIEMITPKIKQIEERFGNGEGLTQDDINTLLLKSQYNHINHLDMKLDEVVADVASLKGEFNGLRGEFNGLKGEFNSLENKFVAFENKITNEIASLKNEFNVKFELLEEKIESTIQKALNKNMIQLVLILGAFTTVFKMLDIFAK